MIRRWSRSGTYPLDKLAVLSQGDHGLVGDLDAVGNIETLEAIAVLGDGNNGGLGNLYIPRDVKRKQMVTVGYQSNEASVCQAFAACQGQPLHAVTNGQGHDASVVNFVGKGGQVEALDEVPVREVRLLEAQSLTYCGVLGP